MSGTRRRWYGLLLHAYPKDFREEYGDAMLQALEDRHRHDRLPMWRLVVGEVADAVRTGPTMRWETSMTRIVCAAVAVCAVVALALAGGPGVLVPAVLLALTVGYLVGRRSSLQRPVDGGRRWLPWAVAGALFAIPGGALLVGSDQELSEVVWALMALSLVAAMVLCVTAVFVAVSRPRSAPTAA